MSSFPGSPRILKGAVIHVEPPDPAMQVVVFQYNPATVSRSLQQAGDDDGDSAGAGRFQGAPTETITLEVTLDATDQLEMDDPTAVALGIHPQLASLEMLFYPASATITGNIARLALGSLRIVPPEVGLTLFLFGPKRIVPVQLTQFNVTEDAHDSQLNPIRARVSLGMRVLSYNDLSPEQPGHAIFIAHQVAKEALAQMGSARGFERATGIQDNLF